MEVGTPFEEFVKKTVKNPPKSFADWEQLRRQFIIFDQKEEDIPLASLVKFVQCLSDALGANDRPGQFKASERIELHRFAANWWITCFQRILDLPSGLASSIESEAVLLNVYHHAVAAGETEIAGRTRSFLEFYKDTILPKQKKPLRVEKLKKELDAISKLNRVVDFGIKVDPAIGLEKAGYKIEWADGGNFVIVPPKNAAPIFPCDRFFETLEFFRQKGMDDRSCDKMLEALAPHLDMSRDKELLQRSFVQLYGDKNLGQWKFYLYCLKVLNPSDGKKVEQLAQLIDSIGEVAENYRLDAAFSIIAACDELKSDGAKIDVLKRLMQFDALPKEELIHLFDKLMLFSLGLNDEILKSEALSALLKMTDNISFEFKTLVAIFRLIAGACGKFEQESARVKLLTSLCQVIDRLPATKAERAYSDMADLCDKVSNEQERVRIIKMLIARLWCMYLGEERRTAIRDRLRESINKLTSAELKKIANENLINPASIFG